MVCPNSLTEALFPFFAAIAPDALSAALASSSSATMFTSVSVAGAAGGGGVAAAAADVSTPAAESALLAPLVHAAQSVKALRIAKCEKPRVDIHPPVRLNPCSVELADPSLASSVRARKSSADLQICESDEPYCLAGVTCFTNTTASKNLGNSTGVSVDSGAPAMYSSVTRRMERGPPSQCPAASLGSERMSIQNAPGAARDSTSSYVSGSGGAMATSDKPGGPLARWPTDAPRVRSVPVP